MLGTPIVAALLGIVPVPECPLSTSRLADDDDARADFLTHRRHPGRQADLPNCSWYSEATCCTSDDALRVSQQDPELRLLGMTRGCRDLLHQFQCSICSPRQADIFRAEQIGGFSVPALGVCSDFCSRLYDRCGSARIVVAAGRPAERVDLTFRDGLQFCRAQGLRVVTEHAGPQSPCFSAGSSVRPGWQPLLVGLVAALTTATRKRS